MKFLADENFDNNIIRGVLRRIPDIAFVRVQDTEISGEDDPRVLEFAMQHGFILLTHDVNTIRGIFYQRVAQAMPVPGVFLIHKDTSIGKVIDELELIILASDQSEWDGTINFVP